MTTGLTLEREVGLLSDNQAPEPAIEVITVGGPVHYSEEFRCYLAGVSAEERAFIVREIEQKHRVRRFWKLRDPDFSQE